VKMSGQSWFAGTDREMIPIFPGCDAGAVKRTLDSVAPGGSAPNGESFLIGKYAVTVGRFSDFVDATGHVTQAESGFGLFQWLNGWWELGDCAEGLSWRNPRAGLGPNVTWRSPDWVQDRRHPVVGVSWNDARAFCAWLTTAELKAARLEPDWEYRLPTEAEWEHASRAGQADPVGDRLDAAAWHESNSGNTTHIVGLREPNAWGLHDTLGNVWELCSDFFAPDAGGAAAPAVRSVSSRGGCCNSEPLRCSSSSRSAFDPRESYDSTGFRLACSRIRA
jgi:sulfatase modifying factor 1